jgi:TrmH family RNA methyltransferase
MIVSQQNSQIKNIRRLRRCKGDHLLLEGPHLVFEACRSGLTLETVLASPEFLSSAAGRRLERELPRPPLEVAPQLLDRLCDADSPRGVLAVARLARGDVSSLPAEQGGITVLAAGLQDPGNLGALARVTEAVGASGLALTPSSVHPNHSRALRASAGSLLRLPVAVGVSHRELMEHLAPARPRSVALVPRGGTNLYEADLTGSLVLIVGAEGPGLPAETIDAVDLRVSIPLAPPVESLNATSAAAIALFEIQQRREGGRA